MSGAFQWCEPSYQSPEKRKFAKEHGNMKLNICKMQGGFRWDLILKGTQ